MEEESQDSGRRDLVVGPTLKAGGLGRRGGRNDQTRSWQITDNERGRGSNYRVKFRERACA